MDSFNLAILGSTKGTDMQAIIDAGIPISIVISNKKNAFILRRARKHNIPAVFLSSKDKTREEYDQTVMKVLESYDIDLIMLIGYMRILSAGFCRKYKNKILNIHPSLLPKYAGGMDIDVHAEVIKNNEKESGCTLHYVTEGVDEGPIVGQKKVEVLESDTPESLKNKVQKVEGELIVEILKNYNIEKND